MGDLKTQNTSYPSSIDTATTIADITDTVVAAHQNGPNTAIVAIETELGTSPKGTAASVSARLNTNMASDGGLRSGSSFPASPPNTPHWFYRTDTNLLYVYNMSTASYDVMTTAVVLANYVQKSVNNTITATHTFAPSVAGAPFILGVNAQSQLVTGLNSDLLDGYHAAQTTGAIPISNGTVNTNLNADLLDGNHASVFGLLSGGNTWTGNQIINGEFSVSTGDGAYAATFINTRGDATGSGLLVQTHWNVAANYVARFLTNSGSTEVMSLKGDQSVSMPGTVTAGALITNAVSAQASHLDTSGTTSGVWGRFANTGGNLYWGIESSTGGFLLGGTSAYSAIFGTDKAVSLHLITNNATRLTINSAGAISMPGSVSTGTLTATGSGNAVLDASSSGSGAQLKFERTGAGAGSGYIGADSTNCLYVFDGSGSFNVRMGVTQAGVVSMPHYGAGAAVFDSSGNISSLVYGSANTASTIVERDGSGNFSATTITADLIGNATSAGNSSGTGTIPYAGETGLKIIRGNISSTGTVTQGSGLSASLASTGVYSVTWSSPFSGIPSVVVSSNGGVAWASLQSVATTGGCTVNMNATGGGLSNFAFSLIAIGPK